MKNDYGWIFTEPDDYLNHSGIPGMKWGHRNGPPYPLSRKGKWSSGEKAAAKKAGTTLGKSTGGTKSESAKTTQPGDIISIRKAKRQGYLNKDGSINKAKTQSSTRGDDSSQNANHYNFGDLTKEASKEEEYTSYENAHKRKLKNMSDADLQKATNRLRAEQQYNQAKQQAFESGHRYISNFTNTLMNQVVIPQTANLINYHVNSFLSDVTHESWPNNKYSGKANQFINNNQNNNNNNNNQNQQKQKNNNNNNNNNNQNKKKESAMDA